MELISIISWLASIFGVIMSLSWIIQAVHIVKRKSAGDVNLLFLSIFVLGNMIFFFYGMLTSDWPVTISFGVGLAGVILVYILALKYR